ncbi:site-specific integrase [Faecalicoccus pleomorphus]|uniref:tyrosine-type recombinase/integrase n=1 Tax=Faecalicoccus pleomorphus TaxID=1323 RepID=UPI00142FBEC9|nr:tyrosine-type recombinase/integrase [Faecalicoccus pleomorphus]NJE40365.1 site-specific integrase [Faecalicoccus pleomorphus]
MASIIKRKNKYCVVYTYVDNAGNKKQKWETYDTNATAKKRKTEIEYQQQSGDFVVPTAATVKDLMSEYVSVYGANKWSMSTLSAQQSLINNYINPIIGDLRLNEITTRTMDKYFQSLLKVKSVSTQGRKPRHEYVSPKVIKEIYKSLRCAFNQAVKWELISRNPVANATIPKAYYDKREIWTVETLATALNLCDDPILALAINLSFSCSLRMGELLGLTWDCIDISQYAIEHNSASIFVNKELQRASISSLDFLDNKDVLFTFPGIFTSKQKTRLILKTPKTKTSVRKIFLPLSVVKMLEDRKKQIDELKAIFGEEYDDYNLVFCHPNGRPMEGQIINDALRKLIEKHNLPKIVFHSFRHASITYKLKWNGGDMKAVQGDSGHAQMDMIADVYSHIIDEDRRFNAQKFEEQFYQAKGIRGVDTSIPTVEFKDPIQELDPNQKQEKYANMGKASAAKRLGDPNDEQQETYQSNDNLELLAKLLNNPTTAALLKELAKNL